MKLLVILFLLELYARINIFDDNVISKKQKFVDKKITLMKKKTEEEIKCIDVLNEDTEKM